MCEALSYRWHYRVVIIISSIINLLPYFDESDSYENFEPNLNITSQVRGLNLGPSMNVSNGVFCPNVLLNRHFRGADNS